MAEDLDIIRNLEKQTGKKLPRLKQLDLTKPDIGYVIDDDGNVVALSLYYTELSDISPLAGLTNLTQLYLFNNKLSDISPLAGLTNLTQLDLSYNQLSDISPLAGLTNLTRLDLPNNVLSDISLLARLSNLTRLNLYNNKLSDISPLAGLTKLTELSLYNNELSDISPLARLSNLTQLSLAVTELSDISPLAGLTNLTHLHLGNNQLSDISPLAGLKNLTLLVLYNNELSDISPLAELTNLTQLDLRENKISKLPSQILALNLEILWKDSYNEKGLNLYNNPLESPPVEIVKKGRNAVINYFKELEEQGEEYVYEAKLIVVGEPGAGKTSLVNKLLDPECPLNPNETMTRGIDIEQWRFTYSNDITFRANIWDFGGQAIMHSVHRYFLTKRSLYIVLADNRKEDTDFYYWLNTVELLSGRSPVLIVLNEKYKYKKFIPEGILKSFNTIEKVCNVDLADNTGLQDVSKTIQKQMTGLPHVGTEPIPKNWIKIRRKIEDDKRDYIDLPAYLDICRRNGVENKKKALYISGFLHDLGVLLHFQKDRILKNTVILNNSWATEAVYLILVDNKIIEKGGEFNNSDFERVWNVPEYAGKYHHLLQLMINFELCYEIENTQKYIIPELLPEKPPADIPSVFREGKDLLQFQYGYTFMPKGIISRLIVRMNKYIYRRLHWKNGVILKIDEATAEIVEDFHNKLLKIRIFGENKLETLAVIRHYIKDLHDTFENLDFDEMVPCICEECKNNKDEPFFYEYDLLKKYEEKNIMEIRCDRSLHNVNVISLMKGVFIPEEEDELIKKGGIYINYYYEGDKVKIEKIDAQGANINIADRIGKIIYNQNSGIGKEEFEQLKTAIEKLGNEKQSKLSEMSGELLKAGSEDEKASIRQRIKDFLINNGIPVAHSLTAAGIVEIAKAIFSG